MRSCGIYLRAILLRVLSVVPAINYLKITILKVLVYLTGFKDLIHVAVNQHGDDPADNNLNNIKYK